MAVIASNCGTMDDSVTVIILTCGKYCGLARTVASILAQNHRPSQVILSDDGSRIPFPKDVVGRLKYVFPDAIIRCGEHNLGTVAHMNYLAGLCDSTYLKYLSAGDAFSDTGALRSLIEMADDTGAIAVTSNAWVCSEDLSIRLYRFPGVMRGRRLQRSAEEQFNLLADSNVISAAGTLIHRKFFTELEGFDEEYRLLEDWPAWLRMTRMGYKIAFLDHVTCLYAIGGVSSENGSAFASNTLREDMKHCCQKEILPYMDMLGAKARRKVLYHYDLLMGLSARERLMRYQEIELRERVKQGAKRLLLFIFKIESTLKQERNKSTNDSEL